MNPNVIPFVAFCKRCKKLAAAYNDNCDPRGFRIVEIKCHGVTFKHSMINGKIMPASYINHILSETDFELRSPAGEVLY